MASIYCCGTERRRGLVRAGGSLNGIDYLVVVVGDGPDAPSGQSALTVKFITNLPTTPPVSWVVSIQGGLRGSAVAINLVTPGLSTLNLLTALPADSGKYTLTLQPSPDTAFDTYLLAVDFYFQSTSITTTDCQAPPLARQIQVAEPQIDYLAKDFDSFQRLMLDRLSAISSQWQERNPADLGIVLVDLLANAADQLSYYQDAVATEAYLGTARQRISVGRHARLFGYSMHQGCNARALVCVELATGSPNLTLTAGHAFFLSRCQDQPVVLGLSGTGIPVQQLDSLRLQYGAAIFELMLDATLHVNHNVISFYTWGDAQCCVPAGATRATLVDNGLALASGDLLVFVEQKNPQTGRSDDADPNHRCAVRLTRVTPSQDRLTLQNVLTIEWDPADALPFALVLSSLVANLDVSDICVALGNVVLVDHGQTIPAEPLTPAVPPTAAPYRPVLQRTGLTFRTAQAPAVLAQLPASALFDQDPAAALPALYCAAPDGNTWTPVAELLHSRASDLQFVAEMDDVGRSILRFGDGTLGQSPVSGLVATYRTGNGAGGNVAAEAIYHVIAASPATIRRVHNPLPASGGRDFEPISEVRLNVPQSFRSQERGITEADYAQLAVRFADVSRAAGVWRWTGAYRTIYLAILRSSGQAVDATFKQNLRDYLERFRLTGTEIVIEPPIFVPLDVSLTVHVADNALRSAVRDALNQNFSDVELPSGARGFFHPDNFGFGQPVYLGQVLAVISQVPGVLWVDTSTAIATNRFQRLGSTQNELANGKIVIGQTELARLGNIPGVLSFGNLEFHLEGGL